MEHKHMRLISHEEVEQGLDEALKDDPIKVSTGRKEAAAIFAVYCIMFAVVLIIACFAAIFSDNDPFRDDHAPYQ